MTETLAAKITRERQSFQSVVKMLPSATVGNMLHEYMTLLSVLDASAVTHGKHATLPRDVVNVYTHKADRHAPDLTDAFKVEAMDHGTELHRVLNTVTDALIATETVAKLRDLIGGMGNDPAPATEDDETQCEAAGALSAFLATLVMLTDADGNPLNPNFRTDEDDDSIGILARHGLAKVPVSFLMTLVSTVGPSNVGSLVHTMMHDATVREAGQDSVREDIMAGLPT